MLDVETNPNFQWEPLGCCSGRSPRGPRDSKPLLCWAHLLEGHRREYRICLPSGFTLTPRQARAHARQYASAKEFDLDMSRMFEKARRWQDPGSDAYGRVLLLQVRC